MKAVILARGLGTRMRKEDPNATLSDEQQEAAGSGVKAMISVGRPFLDHVISEMADAGFTDICLVIGPEHDVIRDYYDNVERERVAISYAVQEEPLGTADAVAAAEEFAGDDRVLVVNSDNFYPAAALAALAAEPGSAAVGFNRRAMVEKSNIPEDRIAAFALLDVDEDGALVDVLEKPSPKVVEEKGEDAPISMNCWLMGPTIFEATRQIELSPRGELELTEAVRKAIDLGDPYTVVNVSEGVLDMSNQGDIPEVAEALENHTVRL